MDFVAQKKGGMAVSAVWTLVYLLAPCPFAKIQKQAAFGMSGSERVKSVA